MIGLFSEYTLEIEGWATIHGQDIRELDLHRGAAVIYHWATRNADEKTLNDFRKKILEDPAKEKPATNTPTGRGNYNPYTKDGKLEPQLAEQIRLLRQMQAGLAAAQNPPTEQQHN